MKRFSFAQAVLWSTTWAAGVALGVALGAWLTVVGAEAAPGDTTLDTTELIVLPAIAAAVVFLGSLVLRIVIAAVRGVLFPHPTDE
jgi:hypothetical protein